MHRYYKSGLTSKTQLQVSHGEALCRCGRIVPLSGSEKWFLGIHFTHRTMNSAVTGSCNPTVFVMPVLTDTINCERGRTIVTCWVKFQNIRNLLSIQTAARPDPASGGHFSQKSTISELFFSCVSWPVRKCRDSHSLSKLKSTPWQARKQSFVPSVKGPSVCYVSSAQRGLTGGCEEHSERLQR